MSGSSGSTADAKKSAIDMIAEEFGVDGAVLDSLRGKGVATLVSLADGRHTIQFHGPWGNWTLGDHAPVGAMYYSASKKAEIDIHSMNYTYLSNAVAKIERAGLATTIPVTYLMMKSELRHRDAEMKIQPTETAPTEAKKLMSVGHLGGLVGLERHAKMMKSAMKQGIPILLIGETGTGKTSLAKELGHQLKRPVVRVNLDGGATPDELIGRYQLKGGATEFELGIVPQAMKAGAILILDELNAALPDTLFALHPLLEEQPRLLITETGEDIRPAEGFCVVATMNPSHEYAGTKQLNAALYSRFGVVLRFSPLYGEKLLRALESHKPTAPADSVAKIALIMETADRLRVEDKLNTRITLREGLSALTLSLDGLTLDESIEAAITGKLEDYERKEMSGTGIFKFSLASTYGLGKMSITEVLEKAAMTARLEKEVIKLTKELAAFSRLQDALRAMTGGGPAPAVPGGPESPKDAGAVEAPVVDPAGVPTASTVTVS